MEPFKIALVAHEGLEIPEYIFAAFAERGIEFVHEECETHDQLIRLAHDADIVWVRSGSKIVTEKSLAELPKCGAILRSGTGTDNVPVAEATRRGIIVANTPRAAGETVAEHTIALLLSLLRKIPQNWDRIRQGIYDPKQAWPDWHIKGQTLGLVGFGFIARHTMLRIRNFGVNFLVYDPYVDQADVVSEGAELVELDDLLRRSDFVSIHCPLTESTHHLIGERELGLMKPKAIIVNTARGPIIDEKALIRALETCTIGGAALDVNEAKPIEPDSPLLVMDNVIVTPHMAGYDDQYLEAFWRHALETLLELHQGNYPPSLVNKDVKPRWELSPRS